MIIYQIATSGLTFRTRQQALILHALIYSGRTPPVMTNLAWRKSLSDEPYSMLTKSVNLFATNGVHAWIIGVIHDNKTHGASWRDIVILSFDCFFSHKMILASKSCAVLCADGVEPSETSHHGHTPGQHEWKISKGFYTSSPFHANAIEKVIENTGDENCEITNRNSSQLVTFLVTSFSQQTGTSSSTFFCVSWRWRFVFQLTNHYSSLIMSDEMTATVLDVDINNAEFRLFCQSLNSSCAVFWNRLREVIDLKLLHTSQNRKSYLQQTLGKGKENIDLRTSLVTV